MKCGVAERIFGRGDIRGRGFPQVGILPELFDGEECLRMAGEGVSHPWESSRKDLMGGRGREKPQDGA